MTDTPIDPALLVPGARVTIEGTVERLSDQDEHLEPLVMLRLDENTRMWVHADNPAIVSVTPPPTDWSKVKRARTSCGNFIRLLAVHGEYAWGPNEAGGKPGTWKLSGLTPLPDEPSAGEASIDEIAKRRFGRNHDKPCRNPKIGTCAHWDCQKAGECQGVFPDLTGFAFNDPRAVSQQEPDMSVHLQNGTPDTRPAWQRAKVGDEVNHSYGGRSLVLQADGRGDMRLYLQTQVGRTWACNSDILEIIKVADENR